MYLRMSFIVIAGLSVSSCASILSGTDQNITVTSNPADVDCSVIRNDQVIARVTTPETVNIKKTKHDLQIVCKGEGFHESTVFVKSAIQDSTWGNIILGGGVGWAVDSARGADNKYAEYVTITMVPLTEQAPDIRTIGSDGKEAKPETEESEEPPGDPPSDF